MHQGDTLRKATLLSVSFLRHGGDVLAPVLANIALEYTDIPAVGIQVLLTVATLALVPALLLATPLVRATSLKKASIIAIALIIAGGVMPLFISRFYLLVLSRLTVGLGLGLLNPVSASLITENYEGEEKKKLIGGRTAIASLGAVLLSLLGGFLARYGWRYIVLSYITGIPIILMVLLFLREGKRGAAAETGKPAVASPANKANTARLWYVTGLIFLFNLFGSVFVSNISMMVHQRGWGDASLVATLMAIFQFSCFMGGILFSRIIHVLKSWAMAAGIALSALSFLLLATAGHIAIVIAATVLCGFTIAWVLTLGILNASDASAKGNETAGISILTAGMSLGGFASPLAMTSLSIWFFGGTSQGAFIAGFACMAVLAAACAVVSAGVHGKASGAAL
jgi:predicted MFS family arabinose efflux permease